MLWKYPPAKIMDSDWAVGSLFGAGRRGLQMGGRRRCGALLRPGIAGRREDPDQGSLPPRAALGASGAGGRAGGVVSGTEKARGRSPRLHGIFDHLTGERS